MIRATFMLLISVYIVGYSLLGDWLEASMFRHVLIQIPCLVLLGYLFAYRYLRNNRFISLLNEKGLAGILLCIFIGAYWMLPRALDAALTTPLIATAKYFSLIVFVGMPLALSWNKMNSIAQAVVKIEFLTMLYRLGWIYLVSPDRLCNFYQLNEQILLGKNMLMIALVLSCYWIWQLFSKDYRGTNKADTSYLEQEIAGSG